MKFLYLTLFFLISLNLYTQNIHPQFDIDIKLMENILSNQNNQIKTSILKDSYNFLELIDELLASDTTILELVDKNHRLSSNYIPKEMINLSDYNLHTRYKTMLFAKTGLDDLINMSNDAKKEGIDIFIASTYRDYKFQDQIFTNMKNYHGEEEASKRVAYPGASQHQLATAIDFGSIKPSYAFTDAGKWLYKNSWKYGFTLSYPEGMESETTYMWEPWHYRYIGTTAALIQKKYFLDIQHYFLTFWDENKKIFTDKLITW